MSMSLTRVQENALWETPLYAVFEVVVLELIDENLTGCMATDEELVKSDHHSIYLSLLCAGVEGDHQ
ncbi:uncharacterized protein CPUR_05453 [Claviceps purpurea 20.1]|uniref:Uncharacterized protein n=1 Tax=Claviceps purpurea (strain 20.1) TaxID=1111077 RepID=M1W858_CLAP2|nr:uncharacterized protein CPUR_05453 [Claviceps purpurea 20.1]